MEPHTPKRDLHTAKSRPSNTNRPWESGPWRRVPIQFGDMIVDDSPKATKPTPTPAIAIATPTRTPRRKSSFNWADEYDEEAPHKEQEIIEAKNEEESIVQENLATSEIGIPVAEVDPADDTEDAEQDEDPIVQDILDTLEIDTPGFEKNVSKEAKEPISIVQENAETSEIEVDKEDGLEGLESLQHVQSIVQASLGTLENEVAEVEELSGDNADDEHEQSETELAGAIAEDPAPASTSDPIVCCDLATLIDWMHSSGLSKVKVPEEPKEPEEDTEDWWGWTGPSTRPVNTKQSTKNVSDNGRPAPATNPIKPAPVHPAVPSVSIAKMAAVVTSPTPISMSSESKKDFEKTPTRASRTPARAQLNTPRPAKISGLMVPIIPRTFEKKGKPVLPAVANDTEWENLPAEVLEYTKPWVLQTPKKPRKGRTLTITSPIQSAMVNSDIGEEEDEEEEGASILGTQDTPLSPSQSTQVKSDNGEENVEDEERAIQDTATAVEQSTKADSDKGGQDEQVDVAVPVVQAAPTPAKPKRRRQKSKAAKAATAEAQALLALYAPYAEVVVQPEVVKAARGMNPWVQFAIVMLVLWVGYTFIYHF